VTAAEVVPGQAGPIERWLTQARARTIAWSAFAIAMGLRVIQLWLVAQLGPSSVRFTLEIGVPTFLAAILLGTASGLVGAIIVARRPANLVGWLYVLTGLMQGIVTAGLAYAAVTLATRPDDLGTFMAWLNGVVDYAVPFAVAALVLVLFPDGRVPAPRWTSVVVLALVGGLIRTLEVGFGEPSMVLLASSVNPYRLSGVVGDALAASSSIGVGSLLVEAAFVAAAVALAARYRGASLEGRQQIRWLLLAGVLAVLSTLPLVYGTLVPGALPRGLDPLALLFATLCLAPIATLIAITRYRLYEIDRIVNRALLYGSLTAILAGVFTAGIGLAQRLFVVMTGVSSDWAIVLTTLVVATLYAPLRKRLEAVVDRRFKYEARFGAHAHELEELLSLVDPREAGRRLAREAVDELQAVGAAVLGSEGQITASHGRWPLEPATVVTLPGGSAELHAIAIGPRLDGRPHDPGELVALERVGILAARAVSARSVPGT
jgi:hypothetical protein